jgi:predicted CxxxxCH...CXXCH cytochrome family protein
MTGERDVAKKLLLIVILLLASAAAANAASRQGQGSCIACHPNGIPTTGTLGCGSCHVNPPATGAHLAHTDGVGARYGRDTNSSTATSYSFNCGVCHPLDSAKHTDGTTQVELYNPSATGVKALNPASAAATGTGNSTICSNVYCHSGGAGAGSYQDSPLWGGTFSGNRCAACHGYPPSYPNNSPKKNSHVSHGGSCDTCHAGTTNDGTTITNRAAHMNGSINVSAKAGVSFGYTYLADGGTCSNVSCHSGNGILVNSTNSAKWGGTLDCAGCHGDSATLSSYAHAKHVNPSTGKGYACDTCHAATVSGSSVIVNPALHGNGVRDVASFYNSSNNTCATSCHSVVTPPNWKDSSTSGCGTCHNALSTTVNGLISSVAHTQHFTASYGPNLDATSVNSCVVCHVYTGDVGRTHADGSVELNLGFSKSGTCGSCHQQSTTWANARVSCESCHTTANGPLSVIGGVTAPDKSYAASAGHGRTGIGQSCAACHTNTSSHIGVAGGTKRLVSALTGSTNAECNYCHQNAALMTAKHLNLPTHYTTLGGSPDMACAACHDPHGNGNLFMIRSTINGRNITFTNNTFGFVDLVSNQGLCQVCHTQTLHYRAGVPENDHPSSDCLSCHSHSAVEGAFKPKIAPPPTCDSCHGYPPAPTNPRVAFGTQSNWANARFEDYSGGGGAHLVAAHVSPFAVPSEGWSNCTLCHNAGRLGNSSYHKEVMPVTDHIDDVHVEVDPSYRFSASFTVYTGSRRVVLPDINRTGSCFNISCHMSPSSRWSIER